jgi:hypothetical protein
MIEDVERVSHGHTSAAQVSYGTRNRAVRHVASWIIVAPYDEVPGMMSAGRKHQIVQKPEIIVVMGQEPSTRSNGAHQMDRIFATGRTRVRRYQNIVTVAPQEPD